MRLLPAFLFLLLPFQIFCQAKTATVSGKVLDENDNPVANTSVTMLGKKTGTATSENGSFRITVPSHSAFALIFSHTGYRVEQKNFYLSPGEEEIVTITLRVSSGTLDTVVVADTRSRREAGLLRVNPKTTVRIPSTTGGIEAMIKTLVGSNNELTSQYNVRGGNYDENIIYINDFEIYRPYLVSSGQQEGLSFINPEMTRNVNFYTGGFPARYGDKMSSVLDIQYKVPVKFEGAAYLSLLEQGLTLGGVSKNKKINFLGSVRNKSNRNLLSSQPTVGAYIPSASDFQGYISYTFSSKLKVDALGIYSTSRFRYYPESVKKTSSVFSPLFTANLGLDIYFEGQEIDRYKTSLLGLSVEHKPNSNLKLKWMLSRFTDGEEENYDIGGAYLFGDRDFDNSSASFGEIINPLGAGYYQNYGRNKLNIDLLTVAHKGSFDKGKHFFQWGVNFEHASIHDKLKQWEYQDSAGYSLPYHSSGLAIYNSMEGITKLDINRFSGYIQDNIHLFTSNTDITIQPGVRLNYNNLNNEWLISPRIQASLKPAWKRDFVFRLAAGIYDQPPFYRELKNYDGTLNTQIKAQKSMQVVGGFDYQFKGFGGRAFRFSTEAYYKYIQDLIPYDIDNVKIRYLGTNNAKGRVAGIEMRLFGELVEDAESWLSIGIMNAQENLDNDKYADYLNAAGEVITAQTADKVVVDSVIHEVGWLRRPTDRRITIGLYLEDYLSTNKNFKFHLNMLYGSNMPYNIPGSVKYRNGLIINPYIRVDVGFSALLLSEKYKRRSHAPFRAFENIWASLEVFNLINRPNTISYQLIKDFSNTTYAIPNRLTPRLVNIKLLARF
ncbi:MAG: TonB-dependent receptor [Ferruginibacter sp.]|nr:TonB-dependent receptor [Ferruginibacter sp.]